MKTILKTLLSQDDSQLCAEQLREHINLQATQAAMDLIEREIIYLCGEKHKPNKESFFKRAGSAISSFYIQGKKRVFTRPRVRSIKGDKKNKEKSLKTVKALQDSKEWQEQTIRYVLCGISTRNFKKIDELEFKNMSKSQISRAWVAKTAELISEKNAQRLDNIDILVLMLDAVILSKDLVVTVALAVDINGVKHILGYQIGSTENSEVVEDLLGNLKQKGLKTPKNRHLLVVLDGSAALRKGVVKHFPKVLIQRCLVHKERNLRGYLSYKDYPEVSRLFKRLRDCEGLEAASENLEELTAFIARKNERAQNSLKEAGDDLINIFKLNLPNSLHVSLLSTNLIENCFRTLRRHIGRVTKWNKKDNNQADLWLISGFTLVKNGFRKIKGYDKMKTLQLALETYKGHQKKEPKKEEFDIKNETF